MKASCYLVLVPTQKRYGSGETTAFRVARSTKNKPALASGESAIKVTIEAEAALFDPQEVGVVVNVKSAMIAAEQEGVTP